MEQKIDQIQSDVLNIHDYMSDFHSFLMGDNYMVHLSEIRDIPVETLKHEAYQSAVLSIILFLMLFRFIFDGLRK